MGFINANRNLSSVGIRYISNDDIVFDKLEKLFGLKTDNITYLRQLLKLRVYDSHSDKYFYNFRFALAFLSKYDKVPISDFLWILESIKPSFSKTKIEKIIDNYESVYRNTKTFDQYRDEEFSDYVLITDRVTEAHIMFENRDFTDENFKRLFPNRKSSNKSLKYKQFVLTLIDFLEHKTEQKLKTLLDISKANDIKKAFGGGRMLFDTKKGDSIQEFLDKNGESPLLSGKYFEIYLAFAWSKHNDLIREYSDMCKRIFSLSGVISFNQGIASLGQSWLLPKIIKSSGNSFILSGEENYEAYENDLSSPFYQNDSLMTILDISGSQAEEIEKSIAKEFGISNIANIQEFIADKQEKEFRKFIEQEFYVSKVITILEAISQRNDKKVQELVTDNALVPTIFEYILAIAWYHVSNKQFALRKSMQLTFSVDNLPLSHAGGNKGDIEIEYPDKMLLLEATLMDKSTQKRGELEPVIRHSVNLALSTEKPLQTIFVANEVDNNVVNIFRATSFIQLDGTLTNGSVDGLDIFALTIPEIISILKRNLEEEYLFDKISSCNNSKPHKIMNGWRETIVEKILE
ncbi:AlwI family type II restriction endonuclease [Streptococcus mutans]|uniref:AlwI family type II restriction endonuclease n=1 Tax=Streptococcus mutans TaxID=1309 RepID=UPI0023AFD98F|nr:AlwI family type II restriction endonuclease [Streptococcus mutans]MDE8031848.1 AlwI family type II restriction endonuclease [Streptococcus mutans]MDT9489195.1 AlwI family type II restriction endonuclease [Streptococcus mutans]MDT9492870.1 AlwI family type II restriction endonuclease [Streptococcus mutans]MDT9509909.1 AlwI family type II restriction endonuclease [Streptococcus mutans]MDT9533789.1 AlwI family type II restriction endonuclease [Streptococcus mutans]